MDRSRLLLLFKRADHAVQTDKLPEPDIAIRGSPSEYDLMLACQRVAHKMLLLADFEGPVVRGEPQRRQFVAEVAALLEHYCGSSP